MTVAMFLVEDQWVTAVLSHGNRWEHAEAASQIFLDSIQLTPPAGGLEAGWDSIVGIRSHCSAPYPAPITPEPSWIVPNGNLLVIPGDLLNAEAEQLIDAGRKREAFPYVYWGVRRRTGQRLSRLKNVMVGPGYSGEVLGYWRMRVVMEEAAEFGRYTAEGKDPLVSACREYWMEHGKRLVHRVRPKNLADDSPLIFIWVPDRMSPKSFLVDMQIQELADRFESEIVCVSGISMIGPSSFVWDDERSQEYTHLENFPRLNEVIDAEHQGSDRDIVIVGLEGASYAVCQRAGFSERLQQFGKCALVDSFALGRACRSDSIPPALKAWKDSRMITVGPFEHDTISGLRSLHREFQRNNVESGHIMIPEMRLSDFQLTPEFLDNLVRVGVED